MRVYYVEKDELYGDTDYSRGQRPMIVHRQVYLRSEVDATLASKDAEIAEKDARIAELEESACAISEAIIEFGNEALKTEILQWEDRETVRELIAGMEEKLKEPVWPNPCKCRGTNMVIIGDNGTPNENIIQCTDCLQKAESTDYKKVLEIWNKENPRT